MHYPWSLILHPNGCCLIFRLFEDDEVDDVLDMKFVYGFQSPVIVVLYKEASFMVSNVIAGPAFVETYKADLVQGRFLKRPGPKCKIIAAGDACFLYSVPSPLCGVLVIGPHYIDYFSAESFKTTSVTTSVGHISRSFTSSLKDCYVSYSLWIWHFTADLWCAQVLITACGKLDSNVFLLSDVSGRLQKHTITRSNEM